MPARRVALFVLLALLAATPAAAQQWVTFQPGGLTGFRIDFPSRPAISGSNAAGTRYGMSATVTAQVTTGDGITFHMTYTAYPAGTASREPNKVLDTVLLGRTAVGTIKLQHRFDFQGHPALRSIVDWHGPQPLMIVALDVTRGDWLYSAYCFAPRGMEDSPAIARFLESFALLPQ